MANRQALPKAITSRARRAATAAKRAHPKGGYRREFTDLDDAVAYTQFLSYDAGIQFLAHGYREERYPEGEGWLSISNLVSRSMYSTRSPGYAANVQRLRDRRDQLFLSVDTYALLVD